MTGYSPGETIMRKLIKPALLACVFAATATAAVAQEPTLIVENGRILVGDGTVLERGTVVIAGDRILLVTEDSVADDVRRIDATGMTVLPGLIDTHVHLLIENLAAQPRSDEEFGTLEPGKLADLIVVDGNPLDELSALRNVQMVVQGGEVVVMGGDVVAENQQEAR